MELIKFFCGNSEYQVTRIQEFGAGLERSRKAAIDSGKEPRAYYAGKVLKNNTVSKKQGGMFYRYNNGRMIKVL